MTIRWSAGRFLPGLAAAAVVGGLVVTGGAPAPAPGPRLVASMTALPGGPIHCGVVRRDGSSPCQHDPRNRCDSYHQHGRPCVTPPPPPGRERCGVVLRNGTSPCDPRRGRR